MCAFSVIHLCALMSVYPLTFSFSRIITKHKIEIQDYTYSIETCN